MAKADSFAQLVSLACHDLRTPLATVHGFAATLARQPELGDPTTRYLGMIETASLQLGELLDRLSLVARIEGGRYEPDLGSGELLDVARAAAERVHEGDVMVTGAGGTALVDAVVLENAFHDLARCAIRHGGLDSLALRVEGERVELAPIPDEVAAIILGEELRDLGAAVAVRAIEALGGSVSVESERLIVQLREAGAQAAEGTASAAGV